MNSTTSSQELSIFNIKFSKTLVRGAILYLGLVLRMTNLKLVSAERRALDKALLILDVLIDEQPKLPPVTEAAKVTQSDFNPVDVDSWKLTGCSLYRSNDLIDDLVNSGKLTQGERTILTDAQYVFKSIIDRCEKQYGVLEEGEGW